MKFSRSYWALPVLTVVSAAFAPLTLSGGAVELRQPIAHASASSGDGITAYMSPPFVQGPAESFATAIETFESLTPCTTGSSFVSPAVGTFSGSFAVLDGEVNAGACEGRWGGANTTTSAATADGTASKHMKPDNNSSTITLTFPPGSPVKYFGFWWSAGGGGDTLEVFSLASDTTPVATFTSTTLHALLGSIPNPYPGTSTVSALDGTAYTRGHYFGRPRDHSQTAPTSWHNRFVITNENLNIYSHAYINLFASGSAGFAKVEFSGGGFEFDNVSISTTQQAPTGELVFIQSVLGKSLTFGSNGGTGTMAALTSNAPANITPNAFTRAGYAFTGWNTAADGTGTSYAQGASFLFTADATLYAQWAPVVTFDANGGSGSTVTQSATGNTALTANTYTRAGYTFAGWSTTSTGAVAHADGATFDFTTPTTLYAQWTAAAVPPPASSPTTTTAPTTTTPTTTTTTPRPSPNTTTPTTVPAPVPDASGVLPTLQPGESAATDNGVAVPVEVFLDGTSTLVMRGQDFQLNLAGDCAGGCTVVSDASGRETIQLRRDGNALVDGFGFLPGTLVHLWMFSEPTYLGSLPLADDGTFRGSVYLAGIEPGQHTLQVNGTSFDGNDRSANLGIIVTADQPSPNLPATGTNRSNDLALPALALVLAGLLATSRRRA